LPTHQRIRNDCRRVLPPTAAPRVARHGCGYSPAWRGPCVASSVIRNNLFWPSAGSCTGTIAASAGRRGRRTPRASWHKGNAAACHSHHRHRGTRGAHNHRHRDTRGAHNRDHSPEALAVAPYRPAIVVFASRRDPHTRAASWRMPRHPGLEPAWQYRGSRR